MKVEQQPKVTEPARDIAGRVLYEEPGLDRDWYSLSEERREPWREDGDRVIAALANTENGNHVISTFWSISQASEYMGGGFFIGPDLQSPVLQVFTVLKDKMSGLENAIAHVAAAAPEMRQLLQELDDALNDGCEITSNAAYHERIHAILAKAKEAAA